MASSKEGSLKIICEPVPKLTTMSQASRAENTEACRSPVSGYILYKDFEAVDERLGELVLAIDSVRIGEDWRVGEIERCLGIQVDSHQDWLIGGGSAKSGVKTRESGEDKECSKLESGE